MSTMVIEPVRQGVTVPLGVDEAWRLFTEETATWWPLPTRSVYEQEARDVQIEPGVGGEMFETSATGERAHWARVLEWEPPRRLVLAWRVNPATPAPTELEVTFAPVAGGTRVEIEHRALERLGEDGRAARDLYAGGWQEVLEAFADATGRKETT